MGPRPDREDHYVVAYDRALRAAELRYGVAERRAHQDYVALAVLLDRRSICEYLRVRLRRDSRIVIVPVST